MEIKIGDVLVMKKPHPCGCFEFAVLRVGMDFRLRCTGCGHEFLISRQKRVQLLQGRIQQNEAAARRLRGELAEKSARQVISKESTGE